jgi:hypothetical protein
MSVFIVLTNEEAAHVRGPASPPYALEPIERQGGVFILPAGVLDHPAYAMHAEFLAALPRLDSADPSFPPALEPSED